LLYGPKRYHKRIPKVLTLLDSSASALCSSLCLKQLLHLVLLKMLGENFLHSADLDMVLMVRALTQRPWSESRSDTHCELTWPRARPGHSSFETDADGTIASSLGVRAGVRLVDVGRCGTCSTTTVHWRSCARTQTFAAALEAQWVWDIAGRQGSELYEPTHGATAARPILSSRPQHTTMHLCRVCCLPMPSPAAPLALARCSFASRDK
jgi:hypothetical protein